MRNRRTSPVLTILVPAAVLGLIVSYFFLPGGEMPETAFIRTEWLSILLAMVCLGATAVSLGLLNYSSFLFTSDTRLLYLPFLLTVLSIPGAMHLSVYHIAAFLMVWSIYFVTRYISSEHIQPAYAFGAVLLSGAASMTVPQLVYAQIYIFLYCLYMRGQSPMRYILSCIAAAAVPWIYVMAWCYISPLSLQSTEFLSHFREGMALSLPDTAGMPLTGMIWCGITLMLGIRAAVFVLSRSRERNKAQKNAFAFSVALSVVCLLAAVFCGGFQEPLSAMVTAVPLSFPVFDLFTNGRRIEVRLWVVLLILAAAAIRVSEFLPGLLPF